MRGNLNIAKLLTDRVMSAVAEKAEEMGIRQEWRGRLQTVKFNLITVSDRLWQFKIRFAPEWDIYEKWNFWGVLPFGAVGTYDENMTELRELLYHDLSLNNVIVLNRLWYGCKFSQGWYVEASAWSKKNIQVVR